MRVALIAAALLWSFPAYAHDEWADGKPIPAWVKASCCGPADAHQLRPDQVHQDANGDYYFTGENDTDHYLGKVAYKDAIPSQDGHYWIFYPKGCNLQQCSVYCFFVPMDF